MKRILLCFVYLLIAVELFACSCITPPPFLEYVASQEFEDRGGVVWEGEYIQDMTIPGTTLRATQYEIRNVWCGSFVAEIVVEGDPISPFPIDDSWVADFPISDDKVWVIGGDEATCLEFHGQHDMVFATTYDSSFGPAFGYSTNLCAIDFFPISETGVVTGFITSNESTINLTVDELLNAVTNGTADFEACEINNVIGNGIGTSEVHNINVFPNPVREYLNFELPQLEQQSLTVKIYGLNGVLVSQAILDSNEKSVPVAGLLAGKYLFAIQNQAGKIYSGQFVK